MKTKLFGALLAMVLAGSAFQSNAAVISVEGTEVEALSVDTSFVDFYNFTDWSANTGYEIANELVAFFVEDENDDLGLFMIFSGNGGVAGSQNFDLLTSEGSVVYVDDPGGRDPIVNTATGSNVQFGYAADKTDGLVFSEFVSDVWTIDVVFNSVSGIDGFTFLSFDNGISEVAISGSLSNLSISSASASPSAPVAQVSAPSSMMILMLSIVCIAASRRK